MMREISCMDAFGTPVAILYQWDKDIYLYVPYWEYGASEVQFSNAKSNTTAKVTGVMSGTTLKVKIPNSLLEQPYTIYGYFYIKEEDGSSRTIHSIMIPIRPRLKPQVSQ